MDTILGRMSLAYGIARRIFGAYLVPLFAGLMWATIRVLVTIGQALDTVFFPRLAKTRVQRPIVLVGNPRTGTTFLQRFMSDQGYGAGNEIYRMLYASLTLQAL
ncbi:MAG: hypothetical protein AAF211_23765, partial [Myxococcota bacterium]